MGVKNVGDSEQVRNAASGRGTPTDALQESMWMRLCCAVVVGSIIGLWLGCRPHVRGIRSPGFDFLDQKEREVQMIANGAILTHNRQSDWLASCGNYPTNCSHPSCSPLLEDTDECNQARSSNKYCSLSGTDSKTCLDMHLDYSRSYGRLPASKIPKSVDTMPQKELDERMAKKWKPDAGEQYLNLKELELETFVAYSISFNLLWTLDLSANRCNKTEQVKPALQGKITGTLTIPHATASPIKLTATKYKPQQIEALLPSDKETVALTCALGGATLCGVISLLVFLYCRYQRRIRDQHKAFLRSIESPIPDVPIIDPLRAIVQEGHRAIEMAAINPEPRVQPVE